MDTEKADQPATDQTKTSPSSAKKQRLPRFRRADLKELPGFRLNKRDKAIIQAVGQHRAMTTPQIQALFFPPSEGKSGRPGKFNSRCQYRLQMLYQYGYLSRLEQQQTLSQGSKPLVYRLDRKGAELLAELGGCDLEEIGWDPKGNVVSHYFLEHLLATNDVRVAISLSAQKHGWRILAWRDEKTLKSPQMKDVVTLQGPKGGAKQAAVVPDGYFKLDAVEDIYNFFLEVDLQTVTGQAATWGRRDWARKVKAYLAYYQSGQYQKRYATSDVRILTVTTGEKRLTNLKRITEEAGGRARFWFTTFEKITPAIVLTEPIWQVADKEGRYAIIRKS